MMNLNFQPMEMVNFVKGSRYECPVYYTLKRDILKTGRIVTKVWLPLSDHVEATHWIKRGVALGCHNDD